MSELEATAFVLWSNGEIDRGSIIIAEVVEYQIPYLLREVEQIHFLARLIYRGTNSVAKSAFLDCLNFCLPLSCVQRRHKRLDRTLRLSSGIRRRGRKSLENGRIWWWESIAKRLLAYCLVGCDTHSPEDVLFVFGGVW